MFLAVAFVNQDVARALQQEAQRATKSAGRTARSISFGQELIILDSCAALSCRQLLPLLLLVES